MYSWKSIHFKQIQIVIVIMQRIIVPWLLTWYNWDTKFKSILIKTDSQSSAFITSQQTVNLHKGEKLYYFWSNPTTNFDENNMFNGWYRIVPVICFCNNYGSEINVISYEIYSNFFHCALYIFNIKIFSVSVAGDVPQTRTMLKTDFAKKFHLQNSISLFTFYSAWNYGCIFYQNKVSTGCSKKGGLGKAAYFVLFLRFQMISNK